MARITVSGMVDELSAALGNRTDITDQRYVQWINWALLDTCGFHQRRIFSPQRFRFLEKRLMFTTYYQIATVDSSTASTVSLTFAQGAVSPVAGGDGYAIETDEGDDRTVTNYVVATGVLTVATPWDTLPVQGTTVILRKRLYSIPLDFGVTNLWAIDTMYNVEDGAKLTHEEKERVGYGDMATIGTPAAYYRYGDQIMFDVTPDVVTTYVVLYYAYPTTVTYDYERGAGATWANTFLELPEYWQEVIVLGAIYRGFERLMEPDRAAEAKKVYDSELVTRMDSYQLESVPAQRSVRMRWK
jgi:hypothetical protein